MTKNSTKALTTVKAQELIERILPNASDDSARALITLLESVAKTKDLAKLQSIAASRARFLNMMLS